MNVNKPYNISIDKARALCSRLHLMYFVYSFLIDSFDILFESVMAQNKGKDKEYNSKSYKYQSAVAGICSGSAADGFLEELS